MKNTTHRVVILKNINSKMIAQAILILKDSAAGGESALIAEAEKIVEKYMNDGDDGLLPKKAPAGTGFILAGAAFLAAGIAVVTYLI